MISVTQASIVCHGLAYITQIWLALTYADTDCSDVGLSHSVFSLGCHCPVQLVIWASYNSLKTTRLLLECRLCSNAYKGCINQLRPIVLN